MTGIALIAGLGNIGRQYEQTRHNAGFWFVDELARQYAAQLSTQSRFHGDAVKANIGSGQVWLLKPGTLMNLSGKSVSALANFYKIPTEQILVVHDELDLAPGQARLKSGGGVAGHNGLKDIRAQCGGAQFWRLRIGIGHPRELGLRQQVADFVLNRASTEHQSAIDRALDESLRVVPDLLAGDFESAMQQLHTATGNA